MIMVIYTFTDTHLLSTLTNDIKTNVFQVIMIIDHSTDTLVVAVV